MSTLEVTGAFIWEVAYSTPPTTHSSYRRNNMTDILAVTVEDALAETRAQFPDADIHSVIRRSRSKTFFIASGLIPGAST